MARSWISGVGRALRGLRAGPASIATSSGWVRRAPDCIRVTSPSFTLGTDLPARFTAAGQRLSPALEWSGIPVGTASLVLLIEDADVPLPIALTHAVLYNIPPTATGLPEAAIPAMRRERMADGTVVGRNSLGALGWLPPSPPPGHGPHHYAFQVFALDSRPSWDWPAGRGAVLKAMRGHLVGWGVLFGISERA